MADVRVFGYTTDHHTGWTHGVSGHSPRTKNAFCDTKEGASSTYGRDIFAPSGTIKLERSSINGYFPGHSDFSDPECRGVALTNVSFVTSGSFQAQSAPDPTSRQRLEGYRRGVQRPTFLRAS